MTVKLLRMQASNCLLQGDHLVNLSGIFSSTNVEFLRFEAENYFFDKRVERKQIGLVKLCRLTKRPMPLPIALKLIAVCPSDGVNGLIIYRKKRVALSLHHR